VNDEEIEKMLRGEFAAAVPDDLDEIIARCKAAGWQEREPAAAARAAKPGKKRGAAGWLAMAAAFALVVGGGFMGWRSVKTPVDVVQMDVNPSIEMKLNIYGRVVDCSAVNTDADPIVGTFNLKGKTVDYAVSKLTGALIGAGYISEDKNSVLISVISYSDSRGQKLAEKASGAAASAGEEQGVAASVMSHRITGGEELSAAAEKLGVSQGKAALVMDFDGLAPEYDGTAFSKLTVSELNILSGEYGVTANSFEDSGTVSTGAYITREEAVNTAAAAWKTEKVEPTNVSARISANDSGLIYVVTGTAGQKQYTKIVHALTGKILGSASASASASGSGTAGQTPAKTSGGGTTGQTVRPAQTARPVQTQTPATQVTPNPTSGPVSNTDIFGS
jgi:hypothetical protein